MSKEELFEARHISISIAKRQPDVYAFASNPLNLPQWAAGLSNGIRKEGDVWITDSPMGAVKVEFTKPNAFGILDHWVTLPSGEVVYNPMRVFGNHEGAEVVFTLFRRPAMTDSEFREDGETVSADLLRLKQILEE